MHVRRGAQVAGERPHAARRDRHVPDAGQGADDAGVAGHLLERAVAANGRDRQQVDRRARGRQEDRDGVVVTRVAVEDDRCRHGATLAQPMAAIRHDPRVGRPGRARLQQIADIAIPVAVGVILVAVVLDPAVEGGPAQLVGVVLAIAQGIALWWRRRTPSA